MKLCFPLNRTHHVTIISAYTSTLTSPDEAKVQFCDDLGHLIKVASPSDKLIILGDFNSRVGKVSDDWKSVLGSHGTGNLNSNSLLLLSKCANHMLCIPQHLLPLSWQVQNNLDGPKIQGVAPDWLCYCQAERYPGCEDNPCHVQCWMLARPPNWPDLSSSYTMLPHSASIPKSSDHHLTWPDWNTPTITKSFRKQLIISWCPVHPMLKTALRSGASLRRSSLKQQKLFWVLRNVNIKIGLMRMMSVSTSCYMQRTRPMWSGKMTQAQNPMQTNSDISEDKPRQDCMRWKTIGGTEKHMKCKNIQTETTPNNSSELWRLYMGPNNVDSALYCQLMDQHWSRTMQLWEYDRQNILTTYWTDLHQSVPLHSPHPSAAHSGSAWSSAISHWNQESHPPDELKLSTRKRWNPSQVVQSYRPRSNWCLPWYPQLHLGTRRCLKISVVPWLWPSTKLKAAKLTVKTIGTSHSYPFPGRSHVRSQSTRSPVCNLPQAHNRQHDFLSVTG